MGILSLTSSARVRSFKSWDVKAARDAILDTLVLGISRRFEAEVKRGLLFEARTEFFDVGLDQRLFALQGFPVDEAGAAVRLFNDTERAYGAETEIDRSNFAVYLDVGQVYVDGLLLSPGARALKVTYEGGLAADTDALEAIMPELVVAASRQVAFEYESRDRLGMRTQSLASGDQVNYVDPGSWIGDMARLLDQMRPAAIF